MNTISPTTTAKRQLTYEVISGGSGLFLALFMWGHMVLVGSILTGERGFNWLATMLEDYYIAQPTVAAILLLFVVHAVLASRKIPAQLRERKKMLELGKGLSRSGREKVASASPFSPFHPHTESLLWIWQVRTGMIILVLGSFHIILLAMDVLTELFGVRVGIEAVTTMERVQAGLWLPYAILLVCVEFHASIGLYRLATKWGAGWPVSFRHLWRFSWEVAHERLTRQHGRTGHRRRARRRTRRDRGGRGRPRRIDPVAGSATTQPQLCGAGWHAGVSRQLRQG
jgi:fumarate reductase subunit C